MKLYVIERLQHGAIAIEGVTQDKVVAAHISRYDGFRYKTTRPIGTLTGFVKVLYHGDRIVGVCSDPAVVAAHKSLRSRVEPTLLVAAVSPSWDPPAKKRASRNRAWRSLN